jgi:hypothetical protein
MVIWVHNQNGGGWGGGGASGLQFVAQIDITNFV